LTKACVAGKACQDNKPGKFFDKEDFKDCINASVLEQANIFTQ
jgi:hypothetical protein